MLFHDTCMHIVILASRLYISFALCLNAMFVVYQLHTPELKCRHFNSLFDLTTFKLELIVQLSTAWNFPLADEIRCLCLLSLNDYMSNNYSRQRQKYFVSSEIRTPWGYAC